MVFRQMIRRTNIGYVLGFCLSVSGISLGISSVLSEEFDAEKWLVYEVGSAVVLPNVGVSTFYDSDVFLGTSPQAQSDFIFSVRPEIKLQFGAKDLSYLNFFYAPSYLRYLDTELLNRVDHSAGMDLNIQKAKTTYTGSSSLGFLGGFIGEFQNFSNNPTDRVTHNHNYKILQNITGKVSGTLAFSYGVQDYEDGSRLLDTDVWRVTGGTVYDLSEKMDLIGEVFYSQSSASGNLPTINAGPDASSVGFFGGAEAEFTPKITGSVRLGYQNFSVDDSDVSNDNIVAESDLSVELSPFSQVGLTVSRGVSQSIQAAETIVVFTDIGVSYLQMLDVAGKWGFNSAVRYRFSEYEGASFAGRTDNYFTFSTGVSYFMRDWFRAGINYSYSDYSANLGSRDYDVHRIGLNFVIGY